MLGKQQQQQQQKPYLDLLLHPGDSHRSGKDYAIYVHLRIWALCPWSPGKCLSLIFK